MAIGAELASVKHCKVESISAYLDQELDSREAAELAEHLQRCQRCREILDSYRRAGQEIRELPTLTVSESLDTAVSAKLRNLPRTRLPSPWPKVLSSTVGLSAAVIVALACTVAAYRLSGVAVDGESRASLAADEPGNVHAESAIPVSFSALLEKHPIQEATRIDPPADVGLDSRNPDEGAQPRGGPSESADHRAAVQSEPDVHNAQPALASEGKSRPAADWPLDRNVGKQLTSQPSIGVGANNSADEAAVAAKAPVVPVAYGDDKSASKMVPDVGRTEQPKNGARQEEKPAPQPAASVAQRATEMLAAVVTAATHVTGVDRTTRKAIGQGAAVPMAECSGAYGHAGDVLSRDAGLRQNLGCAKGSERRIHTSNQSVRGESMSFVDGKIVWRLTPDGKWQRLAGGPDRDDSAPTEGSTKGKPETNGNRPLSGWIVEFQNGAIVLAGQEAYAIFPDGTWRAPGATQSDTASGKR